MPSMERPSLATEIQECLPGPSPAPRLRTARSSTRRRHPVPPAAALRHLCPARNANPGTFSQWTALPNPLAWPGPQRRHSAKDTQAGPGERSSPPPRTPLPTLMRPRDESAAPRPAALGAAAPASPQRPPQKHLGPPRGLPPRRRTSSARPGTKPRAASPAGRARSDTRGSRRPTKFTSLPGSAAARLECRARSEPPHPEPYTLGFLSPTVTPAGEKPPASRSRLRRGEEETRSTTPGWGKERGRRGGGEERRGGEERGGEQPSRTLPCCACPEAATPPPPQSGYLA